MARTHTAPWASRPPDSFSSCLSPPSRATFAHARRRQAHARRPARPCRGNRFRLRYRGKKRVHQADEYMAQIAAERIVEHLERARFVIMEAAPRRSFRAWPGLRGLIPRRGCNSRTQWQQIRFAPFSQGRGRRPLQGPAADLVAAGLRGAPAGCERQERDRSRQGARRGAGVGLSRAGSLTQPTAFRSLTPGSWAPLVNSTPAGLSDFHDRVDPSAASVPRRARCA